MSTYFNNVIKLHMKVCKKTAKFRLTTAMTHKTCLQDDGNNVLRQHSQSTLNSGELSPTAIRHAITTDFNLLFHKRYITLC